MQFDATGKVTLDHIYTQTDPRHYFATLRPLDYHIPQLAKPYFRALIDGYRDTRGVDVPQVVDIGSSYGINAALLRCDVSMDDLYDRYADAADHSHGELLAYDRELVRSRPDAIRARFVGLDVSDPALTYAHGAGFLDDIVCADLEHDDPSQAQRSRLAGTDLVFSTGCLGYVGVNTLARVIAAADRGPWMAHFMLRMFALEPIAQSLSELGYETVPLDGVFRQRRFASAAEQEQVLDTLAAVGVDPTGFETDGWFYAQPFLSIPRANNGSARRDLNAALDSTRINPRPAKQGMTVNDTRQWSTNTFGNEQRLPRLPLPTLAQTCARFLEWSTPLLTPDELAATRAAVDEVLAVDSPYRTLHAALAEFDAAPGTHSWLDLFWPSRYLGRRDRIALNANFFFLFTDTRQEQVDRAAGLIAGAVDYKAKLDAELVAPVLLRGQPLSMEQNKFLFGTTRIPGLEQDTVRAPYSAEQPGPATARHIMVFFHGNGFRLDVIDPNGRPYSIEDLAAGLDEVMKLGSDQAEVSVGSLTSKARAEWAVSRDRLLTDSVNAAALDIIETALFCVALEDFAPETPAAASDHLLYGDGGNRWFDKAVTFVVFADGRAGINVEHCGLDGTTVLSFVDAVLEVADDVRTDRRGDAPAVEPVEFRLDAAQTADVQNAAVAFAEYAAATATTTLSFDTFGADRAKELKVSPDAFVQMAYQLAHRRAKGFVGATYESISTRQFEHGRTEAMRVITPEVFAFVEAMVDREVDDASKAAAFRAAAAKHVERAKDCQAGRAPEQHLWELQWIQRRRGAELGVAGPLTFFDCPGWSISRDDYLSTSSAPSVNIQYFGFGMTSSTCIGIGYVLLPDRFNVYLSTPRPVADQMRIFADHLTGAIAELQTLLSA